MKTISVRGKDCLFFLERSDLDGGMVLNTVAPVSADEYANFRHWYSDPAVARKEYDALALQPARANERVARALDGLVSGTLTQEPVSKLTD